MIRISGKFLVGVWMKGIVEDGVKREIREELGVEANIGRLVHSEQFHQTRDGSSICC